jgi:hypothetical protein
METNPFTTNQSSQQHQGVWPNRFVAEFQAHIRQGLLEHGTDVDRNDADPMGDGDQSPIVFTKHKKGDQLHRQQFYRDLFATGGDLVTIGDKGMLSPFALSCIFGNYAKVKKMLEKAASTHPEEPSPDLIRLLETRESSMRLSPIMLIIAMGKIMASHDPKALEAGQLKVVKLLLKYGARPDAKDVCGKVRMCKETIFRPIHRLATKGTLATHASFPIIKTVCHYGMGEMATPMTMAAVDMCIDAHRSSHLFGKKVCCVD